jgi:hypothetical protein
MSPGSDLDQTSIDPAQLRITAFAHRGKACTALEPHWVEIHRGLNQPRATP